MAAPTVPEPRVCIVSPAAAAANNGNWHTAARWQRFLAPVAAVRIQGPADDPGDADLLIALHARRSADVVRHWRDTRPAAPLALVLTGTDLYRDLDHDPRARHSLECASRVVVLQEEGLTRLDAATRAKAVVIVQSASAVRAARSPGDRRVRRRRPSARREGSRDADARRPAARGGGKCADPRPHRRRARAAARRRRPGRRPRPARAIAGSAGCPHAAARRAIARARALVHPSVMEGGANVVIEAVRSGVPVLASRIDGNVGLLGAGYDGFFPVGDAAALAALMRRFVADAAFAAHLGAQCAVREPLFRPARERRAVRDAGLRPAAGGVAGALRQSESASGPTP